MPLKKGQINLKKKSMTDKMQVAFSKWIYVMRTTRALSVSQF